MAGPAAGGCCQASAVHSVVVAMKLGGALAEMSRASKDPICAHKTSRRSFIAGLRWTSSTCQLVKVSLKITRSTIRRCQWSARMPRSARILTGARIALISDENVWKCRYIVCTSSYTSVDCSHALWVDDDMPTFSKHFYDHWQ
jgi:hypothetical protein